MFCCYLDNFLTNSMLSFLYWSKIYCLRSKCFKCSSAFLSTLSNFESMHSKFDFWGVFADELCDSSLHGGGKGTDDKPLACERQNQSEMQIKTNPTTHNPHNPFQLSVRFTPTPDRYSSVCVCVSVNVYCVLNYVTRAQRCWLCCFNLTLLEPQIPLKGKEDPVQPLAARG